MSSSFKKKKKQAKQFQEQLSAMQENIANTEVEGSAGNGLVTVTMTGDYNLKKVRIKPDCVDPEDIEGLEDLVMAAHADALGKLQESMPSLPGGLEGLF